MFKQNTGYIEDGFDPADVWGDELYGADGAELPSYYRVEGLIYDLQGPYPYCVPTAITTAAEWAYKRDTGVTIRLSQQHLYFHSGGTKKGSSSRQNLLIAKNKGFIPYASLPMPDVNEGKPRDWYDRLRLKALAIPFKETYKIPGFVAEKTDKESLKRAIMKHGPIITGVWASSKDGYYTGNGERKNSNDNHVLLLVGWDDEKDKWIMHESQRWGGPTDGYVTLNQSYTFRFAFAVPEVFPDDWKEKRDEAREKGERYGQPRDYEKEVQVANKMLREFKRFNNKSVTDAAGRFWHLYTNAVTYGGYSYTDVVNDCYHWRRTGYHIFNFNNETRGEWEARGKKPL